MPNPSTIAEMEAEIAAWKAVASHNAKYGQDKNQECDNLRQENARLLAIIREKNELIDRLDKILEYEGL